MRLKNFLAEPLCFRKPAGLDDDDIMYDVRWGGMWQIGSETKKVAEISANHGQKQLFLEAKIRIFRTSKIMDNFEHKKIDQNRLPEAYFCT